MIIIKKHFITEQYLKQNSSVEFNVDAAKINPFIMRAQDIYIADKLGSTFYEHLMSAKHNDTLTSDEEDLIINYIAPALVDWTIYSAFNSLRTKITNKSQSLESSQYSVASERADLNASKIEIRDMAEFYTTRLVRFLNSNSNLFTLYESATCDENIPKNNSTYFSGMDFSSGSNDCNC